jgi:hypothetical protein
MLGPPKARRVDRPVGASLEALVPQDNFYRHLAKVLDLAFVRDLVRDKYAPVGGRPSLDPVVFFQLQLIVFFEGLRSERQLVATASLHLAHRWYLGYALDEPLPDHSTLSRIRQRLVCGSGTSAPAVVWLHRACQAEAGSRSHRAGGGLALPGGGGMEEEWCADRARLRSLASARLDDPIAQLAEALGRSTSWVKKWLRRLGRAAWDDEAVLHSRSRARRHPPPAVPPLVVERILALRDQPPAHLQRTPGPKAILSFLHHDPELQAAGLPRPRSTATVWRLLRRHGRIAPRRPHLREPWDLPEPLTSWQLDRKDVSSVPRDRSDPAAKRQHVVESLDCVDCGPSLLVTAQVRDDFTEETTLTTVADLLRTQGRPPTITLDRDPRFVGAPGTGDFPSPLIRLLTCLGVEVQVNPPRRPDLHGFVERFHRTLEEECLRGHRPATLEAAREVTATLQQHSNAERPNQARSCRNQPPRVAFPSLPPRPPVPPVVDPDGWLRLVDGRRYPRTVKPTGSVAVEHPRYYVGRRWHGQRVLVAVVASERQLAVWQGQTLLKRLPLRGLRQAPLPFEWYVTHMAQEARIHARRPWPARRPAA